MPGKTGIANGLPVAQLDIDRLRKLLAMTGSAHAGEAANAAVLAGKLVRAAGLTWRDVIPDPSPRPSQAELLARSREGPVDRQIAIEFLRENWKRCRPREIAFLRKIRDRERLSE